MDGKACDILVTKERVVHDNQQQFVVGENQVLHTSLKVRSKYLS